MPFVESNRTYTRLRMALCSPAGGGKTWTALTLAFEFTEALGGRVYVIDAEKGSAHVYADKFPKYHVDAFEDVNMDDYGPLIFKRKIEEVERSPEPTILIIDGLSAAWSGKGGALELVDKAAALYKGNKFSAWRNVTPQHNALLDAILRAPTHIIATMRMKDEYVLEDQGGKKVPKKIGLEVIQRAGIEYEFDIVGELDLEHSMWFTKTRCSDLDGKRFHRPGKDVADILLDWCGEVPGVGTEAPVSPSAPPAPSEPAPPQDESPEPPNDQLTIQVLLDRLPGGLRKIGVPPDDVAEAAEAAILLIREQCDGAEIKDIPNSEAERIRKFMRGDMIERLHHFVPKKEAA